MYTRRNDSRMGDEVFAMGAVLAPFVWKFVKHGQNKAIAKKEAFEALPKDMQEQIKYKKCVRGEKISKYLLIIFAAFEVFAILAGHFSIADIMSFLPVGAAYYMSKAGKKKYEANSKAAFE